MERDGGRVAAVTEQDDMRDDETPDLPGEEPAGWTEPTFGDLAEADDASGDGGSEEDAPAKARRRGKGPPPELPTGYRASKRGSRSFKQARKAMKQQEVKEQVAKTTDSVARYSWLAGRMGLVSLAVAIGLVVALFGSATLVNQVARWWAKRQAEQIVSPEDATVDSRENLLVIAKDGDDAHAFLALRVDTTDEQVWGLAIPAAVFAEVPGRGFDRIGISLDGGPDESLVTVSNFLGVPFEQYVVVDVETYQAAMEAQSVAGLIADAEETNLSAAAMTLLGPVVEKAAGSQIGLAPLPVKPISLGDEEYLEAETAKVSDLLEEWWGVKAGSADEAIQVIVYNGSGSPGVAGIAAKALVKSGLRIVGTGNADRFDYKKTVIAVHSGELADGDAVRQALGVGEIVEQDSGQQVADVIVIIGRDYAPPPQDG